MSFQEFGLLDEVVHGVQSMGYVDPTPIQLRAIPVVLSGKDLMGSAQTGTGKTAAFALPILTKLKTKGKLRALISSRRGNWRRRWRRLFAITRGLCRRRWGWCTAAWGTANSGRR
jgi:hypothetical protein